MLHSSILKFSLCDEWEVNKRPLGLIWPWRGPLTRCLGLVLYTASSALKVTAYFRFSFLFENWHLGAVQVLGVSTDVVFVFVIWTFQ